ncbi:MAG: SGNH/GDSL hydrolase family protein [Candidatus Daviesbacteria bacterium]|nr:SGNH/GDSL hydrolase family protein [Candidatus Daviesbacteria bacterium]
MRFKILIIPLILLAGITFFVSKADRSNQNGSTEGPKEVNLSGKSKVKYPQDFVVVMIGDSMTEALGNSDEIKSYLTDYYPDKTFEVLNYGFGATNILSAMDRIVVETQHGRSFRPINEIAYDLILLESFGQNPLSEYSLDEGLKRQTEELDKIVEELTSSNPQGKIVFITTISPNKMIFAKNQVDLSPQVRKEWVAERIAYMKNHIKYAKENNIPLINVFEESLMENADGNPEYISEDDYIHPSPTGIRFISRAVADFIYENNIFQR